MSEYSSQVYFEQLYKRAAQWLLESGKIAGAGLPESMKLLLQELSINRVELEMQNEELRLIQEYAETTSEKFKELYDSSPSGIVETDDHGLILHANKSFCSIANQSRNAVLQRPLAFFISQDDREQYYRHLNLALNNGTKDTCFLKIESRKGTFTNILMQTSPISTKDTRRCFTSVTEIPDDISVSKNEGGNKASSARPAVPSAPELAMKRIISELEHKNRELEEFTSIVSHDLQEPVRMAEKLSQILSDKYKNQIDPKGQELIQIIISSAVKMRELIRELLNLSKISSQGAPYEWFNPENILSYLTKYTLHHQIESARAEVTFDPLPEVYADKVQLEHVLQNLISNAVKYRKAGMAPKVHISSAEKENEWLFSVRDNGIGIDPRFQKRIFHIFQRLHLPGEYDGTGVGLTLCKKIIERHNGRIWVESEEGKGSVFYFTIPK